LKIRTNLIIIYNVRRSALYTPRAPGIYNTVLYSGLLI